MKKMMRFVKGKKKESSRDGDQRSESSFGSRSSLAMSASTSALNIQGKLIKCDLKYNCNINPQALSRPQYPCPRLR